MNRFSAISVFGLNPLIVAVGIHALGAIGVYCALKRCHFSRQKKPSMLVAEKNESDESLDTESAEFSEESKETESDEFSQELNLETDACGAITNVAVTGSSKSGKSSLINALRKMDDLDRIQSNNSSEPWLNVTVSYPDPDNDNLVYWEVPEIDRCIDEHIHEDIRKFDCLIVLISKKFMKMDIEYIKEAQKLDIPVIVVSSKTDVYIENEIRWQQDADIEEIKSSLKYRITKNVTNELLSADLRPEKVLLVSCGVIIEECYSNKYAVDEIELCDFISDLVNIVV